MLKAFLFPLQLLTCCEVNLNNNFVLHLFKSSATDVMSDYYSSHECMCITLHSVFFCSWQPNTSWALPACPSIILVWLQAMSLNDTEMIYEHMDMLSVLVLSLNT